MSYQMVHMEVAYRLLAYFPQIENKADYIFGAVAPDSVHMNAAYQVPDKVKTHLFEGCGVWATTGDYKRWMENIESFWQKQNARCQSEAERDFAAGICVHAITDLENSKVLWDPFREKYGKDGVINPDFYQQYNAEQYAIDQWLYQNSPHKDEIFKLLTEGKGHELHGFLKMQDMEKQKEWMLHHQYADSLKAKSAYEYMNPEIMEAFIRENVRFIMSRKAEKKGL